MPAGPLRRWFATTGAAPGPAPGADDLVALHSSDPVSVYLSALVRMANPSLGAIDRALYDERTLVRHHAIRRTLWVATPATALLMHAAATRKLAGIEHRRTVKFLQENGIGAGDAWLAEAKRDVLKTVAARGRRRAGGAGVGAPVGRLLAAALRPGHARRSAVVDGLDR